MGKVVHLNEVRAFIARTPVFRARDIRLIVGSEAYTALLLHNLEKRGEVHRVTKGWYSVRDDPSVSVFAFRPAYIGLQEALSLRGVWEQETNVVIVTALRVRPGAREMMESNVVLHRISRRYLFGFEYLRYGDLHLPVSDIEKTLIDLVYFRELPGKDVLRDIAGEVDRARLHEHLRRYPEEFRQRVWKAVG